jgi:hypothetical protein
MLPVACLSWLRVNTYPHAQTYCVWGVRRRRFARPVGIARSLLCGHKVLFDPLALCVPIAVMIFRSNKT